MRGFMLNNSSKLCKSHKEEQNFSSSDQIDKICLFNLLIPNANCKHLEHINFHSSPQAQGTWGNGQKLNFHPS